MMASAYPHHPGGIQQPGIPHGHPMGPGPGPNPGQPMGQPMQMHPGVSGPNGPHVSQAGPMMGMQPGMGGPGPSAHALSHLTPQAHMFQQQQQQMFAQNPALAMQAQQQRQAMMRQQHQQHQQMMQQQQQNGMMGFPHGGNQGMTPQQMAAMQGNPQGLQVNLPPHIRAQLTQNQMQQAQQQHAQAQQQAQQQQQLMAQHHTAMQHVASQQSNPGQGGPQNQQPPQGQPGQMRPQPPGMQPGHEAQASPAPPPSQHHTPQQTQSQPQPPPPAQAPTPVQQGPPPPGPPPQQQQQPQPPQQQPQQPQQPGQQPPQNQQQAMQQQQQQQQRQQMAQQQMMQQRAQAAQAQAAQAHAQQNRMYGTTILKLLNLADNLSRFSADRQANDITHWKTFVGRFFSEDGIFKQTLLDYAPQAQKPKNFEICNPALPRYYYTQFQSGVQNIQLTMDGITEKEFGNNCHYVESNRAKFIYWFKNGTQVVQNGKLSAMFDRDDKINLLIFETADHMQYLPRSTLEGLFHVRSPHQNMSPKMSKKNPPNQRNPRMQNAEPTMLFSELPEAPVSTWGVTNPVLQFLEVGETLSNMQELFAHYHANPGNTPSQAMNSLVANLNIQQQNQGGMAPGNPMQPGQQQQGPQPPQQGGPGQPQINLPPGAPTPNSAPGARTPQNMAGGNPNVQPHPPNQQFMSPHIANLQQFPGGLNPAVNGSPHLGGQTHTPSPAQAHMQAPGLVAQHSQQGTNSSAAASANTSPNVSNKRRRSTVKTEVDDGPDGAPTAKVKPSPRMPNNNKRIKGNPG